MATLKELIDSGKPLLVDFYAEWSEPCKTMSMILKEFKRQVGDELKVVKIDVDKYPKVVRYFKVKSVPTLIIFKDGEIKWKKSGMHTVPQLTEVMETLE